MAIADKNMVSADFWANMAAEHIYNSAERRVTAAANLKTIILWAFGLFSVGGFALNLFGGIKDFHQTSLIFFGICFFLLVLAYYFASEAQSPAAKIFIVGEVTAIATAFSESTKRQTYFYNTASLLTGLGFFFLAMGLLVQFGNVKGIAKVAIALPERPQVKVAIVERNDSLFMPLTIQWRKNEAVQVQVIKSINGKADKNNKKVESLLFNSIFYTDTSGHIFYSYYIPHKNSVGHLLVKTSVIKMVADTLSEQATVIKVTLPSL